jgi:hypothetical protein
VSVGIIGTALHHHHQQTLQQQQQQQQQEPHAAFCAGDRPAVSSAANHNALH